MRQESEIKGEVEIGGRSVDPYPGGEIHDEEEGKDREEESRWRRGCDCMVRSE